jgi:hypothetical protein
MLNSRQLKHLIVSVENDMDDAEMEANMELRGFLGELYNDLVVMYAEAQGVKK